MACPAGQFYSEAKKRCLPLQMKPASKGKSLEPCPQGQVWNPNPDVRRCLNKDIFKLMFGPEKAKAASLEQKRLTNAIKEPKKNKTKKTSPKIQISPKPGAITPALEESVVIQSSEPRKNALMVPGSREEMIKWLTKNCANQEDPATMESFKETPINELRTLIKLGSGFCYTAKTLDQHVRASIERGVPIKDIMNPSYRLDAKDFGALKTASKLIKKTYELPTEESVKPPLHYKLFIGVADDPHFKLVFLFDERKVTKEKGKTNYTNAIPDGGWIGYIPVKGTETLEKLIKEAFARGRLFTKAERPFVCCRVHVKKDKTYWSSDKIKALEEELAGIL